MTAKPDSPKSSDRSEEGIRVDINVGHACNNRCVFCMQGHSSKEQQKWLSLEKFKKELDHYAGEKNLHSLGVLGGEPTIYPYLFDALEYAKKLGFDEISLNTNGYRLADADWARKVVEAGVNRFCISVHSERPDIEDYLSGKKGSMINKVTALKNLLKLRKEGKINNISFNAVLNSRNLPTIDKYIQFYGKLGVKDIRFNYIRPEGRSRDQTDLVPRYKDAMVKIMNVVSRNESVWNLRLSFGEIPYCIYPESFFSNVDLRKKYVGEYVDRRTFVSSFNNPGNDTGEDGRQRFVWQDLKSDVLKTYVTACKSCIWAKACGGVWTNYVEMFGDEEFSSLTIL